MRWVDLVHRALGLLGEQAAIADVPIRRSGEIHKVTEEQIAWSDLSNPDFDNTQYVDLQLDEFAANLDRLIVFETAIRAALDKRVCFTVDGLRMQSVYVDSRSHPDTTKGFAHRSIDFRLQAVR